MHDWPPPPDLDRGRLLRPRHAQGAEAALRGQAPAGGGGLDELALGEQLSQELAQSHPAMRAECARQLELWTTNVAKMLSAAKKKHKPATKFDPVEVAWYLNSIWQGSMLIGKTCQTPEMIRRNIKLARSYVDGLFGIHS